MVTYLVVPVKWYIHAMLDLQLCEDDLLGVKYSHTSSKDGVQ